MKALKKILLLGCLFGISAPFMTGCGGAKNDANTLNVVCLNKGYGSAWIEEAVKIWKEENPGYDVNLNLTTAAQTLFEGNIKKSNNTDDLYLSVGFNWKEYSEYLLELDSFLDEEVDGVAVKNKVSSEYRNSLYLTNKTGEKHAYRLPWISGVGGIMYNKYLFDLYGWRVPTTYSELVALCKQIITENRAVPGTRNKTVKPFVYTGNNTDYFDYAVFTWWSQLAGTEAITEFKNYTKDDKENFDASKNATYAKLKEATGMWYTLFGDKNEEGTDNKVTITNDKTGKEETHYLCELIADAGDLQSDNHSAQKDFKKCYAAMMFNGDWCYNEIYNYDKSLPDTFQLRIMDLPKADNVTENNAKTAYIIGEDQFMVIPKTTIKADLAKSFLKVIASDRMIKIFAEKAKGFLGFELSNGALNPDEFEDQYVKSTISYKNNHPNRFTNFSSSPLFLNDKVDFWVSKRPFLELLGGTKTLDTAFSDIASWARDNWKTWCDASGL